MMTYRMAKKATSKNIEPTIQCRVQKHTPEAIKISVAAMSHCTADRYCMRNWMKVIL